MTTREEQVLLKIGRASGPYKAAVLNALDVPIANALVARYLAQSGPMDGWYRLTETGLREAQLLEDRS